MLHLQEKDRDAVVQFLQTVIVPAQTGAWIMQIVQILSSLPDVEEKENTKK